MIHEKKAHNEKPERKHAVDGKEYVNGQFHTQYINIQRHTRLALYDYGE